MRRTAESELIPASCVDESVKSPTTTEQSVFAQAPVDKRIRKHNSLFTELDADGRNPAQCYWPSSGRIAVSLRRAAALSVVRNLLQLALLKRENKEHSHRLIYRTAHPYSRMRIMMHGKSRQVITCGYIRLVRSGAAPRPSLVALGPAVAARLYTCVARFW